MYEPSTGRCRPLSPCLPLFVFLGRVVCSSLTRQPHPRRPLSPFMPFPAGLMQRPKIHLVKQWCSALDSRTPSFGPLCAVLCGVVWCGVVWCGVVWCGVVWCGVVWCGVVWCGVVWCGVVWCGVVWCGVVWCGVPKALLPKGKGRDVYPRVQVNGLGCVYRVRAVCKCVVA